MTNLDGKVALVAGSSRGIGAEIAVQLAAKGASIFLSANDTSESLQRVAARCSEANKAISTGYGIFDFRQEGAPEKMVEAAIKALGRVDILVNNAVIRIRHMFGDYSNKEFDEAIAVNLKAAFFASQAVVPVMKANGGGRIIHIASQMGMVTDQEVALYGLTKAALIHLTKSMAFELAPHNIVVNAVSPGPTMSDHNVAVTTKDPAYKAHRLSYIRAGRYGRPEEIAEVVTFLATTDATFMQGHNLVVDGGFILH